MNATPSARMDEESKSQGRLNDSLRRNFGQVILDALEDPSTTDVLLNPDGRIWHGRLGRRMVQIGEMSANRADMALRTLASALNTIITPEKPCSKGYSLSTAAASLARSLPS